MKSERRHELQENSLVRGVTHLPDFWRQYGSKLSLLVIGIILAIVLFRSWRTNQAEAARASAEQLSLARSAVEDLRGSLLRQPMIEMRFPSRPEQIASHRDNTRKQVEELVAQILGNSKDATEQAEAKLVRADLYLHLATLASFGPPVEASTRPTLAIPEEPSKLLDRASEDYAALLGQASSLPPRIVIAARFGSAAVAENRQKWNDAKAGYEQIVRDAVDPSMKDLASTRLMMLPRFQTGALLGEPRPDTQPTTAPGTQPTSRPATQATQSSTTQPSTTGPTSGPTTIPSGSNEKAPPLTTAPTTQPASSTPSTGTPPAP